MSQLTDRLERDLREIAAGARPSPSAWESIVARLGDDAESAVAFVLAAAPDRSKRRVWIAAAAAALVVITGSIAVVVNRAGDDHSVSSADTAAPAAPPFVGSWVSTDADGSSQTMEIVLSGTDEYEMVVHDDAATAACAGAAATMTGTGLLETDVRLVIAQPELTCDDGTTPFLGPPPQAELANFTLELDSSTNQFFDSFGVVWRRAGTNDEPASSATSGGMWPQSTLDEVRAAQELADAGDPAYTWQLDEQLADGTVVFSQGGHVELVDRFLGEVLGWEEYIFWDIGLWAASDPSYSGLNAVGYLRCAPGRTNPLYPGEWCAPTIDDLHYESVSLDLAQLDSQGPDGVWVVNRWRQIPPFAQADPAIVEAQGVERLEEFLAARIAGTGAEGLVVLSQGVVEVPLLYATTSGAPYERFEIERVSEALWPYGVMTFSARLFADGDATVVEQEFHWGIDAMSMWDDATTEKGQPITLAYTSSDGEVTVSTPSSWDTWSGGGANHDLAPGVWFWEFYKNYDREYGVEFTDPVAYDAWCAANGGSPLLSAPANAAAIAQQLVADPNFETTAPVAARIGGLDAVSIDVALAPAGKACGVGYIVISRWIHTIGWDPGLRLRLYLVDLPEGMSVPTLAITVWAPEELFDEVIEETKPIIDSIQFHTD